MIKGGGPKGYSTTGKDSEHILSFYVFQASLLHSEDFQSYWKEMPCYRDYMVNNHNYCVKALSGNWQTWRIVP